MKEFLPVVALIAALIGGIYLSVRGGNLAEVDVVGDRVRITPTGFNKIWALKKKVEVPLSEIESVRYDPNARRLPAGLRLPGTAVPGMILAGTYRGKAGTSFWLIHRGKRALVMELSEDSKFRRIIVDIKNPESVAQVIEDARKAWQTGRS